MPVILNSLSKLGYAILYSLRAVYTNSAIELYLSRLGLLGRTLVTFSSLILRLTDSIVLLRLKLIVVIILRLKY